MVLSDSDEEDVWHPRRPARRPSRPRRHRPADRGPRSGAPGGPSTGSTPGCRPGRSPLPGAASPPSWPGRGWRAVRTALAPATPASGARPWSPLDVVCAKRRECPVLEEHVNRASECGGAGDQHRGGIEPIIGTGKEADGERSIHGHALTSPERRRGDPVRCAFGESELSAWLVRSSRRRSTRCMRSQAAMHVRIAQRVAHAIPGRVALGRVRRRATRRDAAETLASLAESPDASVERSRGPVPNRCTISRRRGSARAFSTSAWRAYAASMTPPSTSRAPRHQCRSYRCLGPLGPATSGR